MDHISRRDTSEDPVMRYGITVANKDTVVNSDPPFLIGETQSDDWHRIERIEVAE